MGKVILIVIGLFIALIGVIMIYDSRILTKKFFSFGDQNEGSFGLKIVGFIVTIIGAFIIFFVVNSLLKLPFDEAFLEEASLGALLVRTGRYAVNMFLIVGVYPAVFPLYERIGKQQVKREDA